MNDNDILDEGSDEKPIILSEKDYVVFTIGSNSGKIYLRKILTAADYNKQNILTLKLKPEDTINLQPSPCTYLFSFAYMPNKGEDCYTYATGYLKLLPSLSTTEDLKNILGANI